MRREKFQVYINVDVHIVGSPNSAPKARNIYGKPDFSYLIIFIRIGLACVATTFHDFSLTEECVTPAESPALYMQSCTYAPPNSPKKIRCFQLYFNLKRDINSFRSRNLSLVPPNSTNIYINEQIQIQVRGFTSYKTLGFPPPFRTCTKSCSTLSLVRKYGFTILTQTRVRAKPIIIFLMLQNSSLPEKVIGSCETGFS